MPHTAVLKSLVLVLVVVVGGSAAAAGCDKPDESFVRFLDKFIGDNVFRLERTLTPLPIKGSLPDGRRLMDLSVDQMKEPYVARMITPMSIFQMELEDRKNDEKWGLEMSVVFAKDSATVTQGSHNADVWSRAYRYELRDGCWQMVEVAFGGS